GVRIGSRLGPHKHELASIRRVVTWDVPTAELALWWVWADREPREVSPIGGADGVDAVDRGGATKRDDLTEEPGAIGRPSSAPHVRVWWEPGDVEDLEAGPIRVDRCRAKRTADTEENLAPVRRPVGKPGGLREQLFVSPVGVRDVDVGRKVDGRLGPKEQDVAIRAGHLRVSRSRDGDGSKQRCHRENQEHRRSLHRDPLSAGPGSRAEAHYLRRSTEVNTPLSWKRATLGTDQVS